MQQPLPKTAALNALAGGGGRRAPPGPSRTTALPSPGTAATNSRTNPPKTTAKVGSPLPADSGRSAEAFTSTRGTGDSSESASRGDKREAESGGRRRDLDGGIEKEACKQDNAVGSNATATAGASSNSSNAASDASARKAEEEAVVKQKEVEGITRKGAGEREATIVLRQKAGVEGAGGSSRVSEERRGRSDEPGNVVDGDDPALSVAVVTGDGDLVAAGGEGEGVGERATEDGSVRNDGAKEREVMGYIGVFFITYSVVSCRCLC